MRWFRFALLLIVAAIIQAGFADARYKPDILLILMSFSSIYSKTNDAIITSFLIGLACDLIGPAVGAGIISFGLLGSFLSYLNRVITIRRMPYQAVTIFIMGLLTGLSINFLNRFKSLPFNQDIYITILWTSLLSAVVGPLLFLPAAWWLRIDTTGRKRTR
jgi:rod shape-determining protein MreD